MNDQKNIFMAIFLSMAILFGYQYFFDSSPIAPPAPTAPAVAPTVAAPVKEAFLSREQALLETKRVPIETPLLKGSINLQGALFDDLVLTNYKVTTKETSPAVVLLSPSKTKEGYRASSGWEGAQEDVPTENTVWTAKGEKLTPSTPLTLTWNNGKGLVFEKVISIDDKYLFSVKERVINQSTNSFALTPKGSIVRTEAPQTSGFFILHEGPLGVFGGKLQEVDYQKLKDSKRIEIPTQKSWLGITDKYWLTALIPDQKQEVRSFFTSDGTAITSSYLMNTVQIVPGMTMEMSHHFFAGAKELNLLDHYEKELGIDHFDLAVDFGWFYFLTKPLFYILTAMNKVLGNFGLSILLLTVIMKALFFPLANKSYRSMAKMKNLQPKIEALRARYEDDRMKLNEEMMKLYQKEKINPMSGCLPMLVQIPVFFALYKVLFVSIEMRQAPFFGWIHDLSAPDPTNVFNLFGLIPWDPPSFLVLGAWPLFMGATMLLQQKMNPPPADPVQAKMFMIMPIFFTYMLANFPAGLVIYWAWSNLLSIAQQWLITRQVTARG